jgi:hypothetical protein
MANGLPLPKLLLDLIRTGRWKCPTDTSGLDQLFPVRGEFCCWSFEVTEGETGPRAILPDDSPMWRGTADWASPPGDLDPSLAVMIADLGIGYDQPIALDYRLSMENPRVLTLRWDKPAPPVPWKHIAAWREGKRHYDEETTALVRAWDETTMMGGWNRWVEVARDFKTFAESIGL